MTCRRHAFERIKDEEVEYPTHIEKRSFAGSQCRACGVIRGGRKTLIAYDIENKQPTVGGLPEWIESRIVDGRCTLRAPESIRRKDEVEMLCRDGRTNGTFVFNSDKGEWGAVEIRAPQVSYVDRLPLLRAELTRELPHFADWINRATSADLETAVAIIRVPEWQRRAWLPRIWTALVRAHSKRGDAAATARRLGARIPMRSVNSQWFFGHGRLNFRDGSALDIRGEECIPDRRLADVGGIDAESFHIVENRDLAWHHKDGLTFCLDGNPTTVQLAFLETLDREGVTGVLWPDADAEGVRIARAVRRVIEVRAIGLRTFPLEWGVKLDDEKRNILLQELRAPADEYTPLLEEFNDLGRFWEQERIYAEAEIAGIAVDQLPRPANP